PGAIQVDVREEDDYVVVIADLPGVDKSDVSLRLLDPGTLQISTQQRAEMEEEREGYFVRERTYGGVSRLVCLPTDVTDEGATTTFKNGVLEVRLLKTVEERGKRIPVT
ncbi:MAG TPA: Hsp20/alpha crystallin family protein, partial [Methanomicrobiales archaeon]|nr:Hsp20/alpha crystallin family protein [Methanomicrobiales archaeon]